MIELKIEDHILKVPTNCKEIRLDSYIEFNIHHNKFVEVYNEGSGNEYAASEAVKALACVIDGFDDELAMKLTIGHYKPADKTKTINELLYLVNSVITSYQIPKVTDELKYTFEYKGKNWVVPFMKDFSGRVNPDLKYGQYIEAMETMRICNIKEAKTPEDNFTEYLRTLAAIVREEGYNREETVYTLRKLTDDQMTYFKDIDMEAGLDVYFFLNATISF